MAASGGDAAAGGNGTLGKAVGFVSLVNGQITVSLDLQGFDSIQPVSAVANVDGVTATGHKALGKGTCQLGTSEIKTGTCKWASFDASSLGPPGRYKASYTVFFGDNAVAAYYAEIETGTWAGPTSVFGIAVSGRSQELAKKLALRYGMPLEDRLMTALAGSWGVDMARDRLFPDDAASRTTATTLARQAGEAELAKHVAQLDSAHMIADNELQRAFAAAQKLGAAEKTSAVASAVAAYNAKSDGAVLPVDRAVAGAARAAFDQKAGALVAAPNAVVPADVVAPLVRQDDPAPEGGFCGSFLAKLCAAAPGFVASRIAVRMVDRSGDGIAAVHADTLAHFPRRDANGNVLVAKPGGTITRPVPPRPF